jgi:hypothetical protein
LSLSLTYVSIAADVMVEYAVAEQKKLDDTIRRGHDRLSGAFSDIGYTLAPTSGVIAGVKVYDLDRRYLFTWHPRPHHILFYIRKPALKVQSALRQGAADTFPPEMIRENPGGETLITLRREGDANDLVAWLFPQLPLPASSSRARK